MLSSLKFFDAYTIRARIFPALIAGLPTLVLPFILVPWDRLGASAAIATVMSLVLLYAFSDVARRCGLRVERKLGTRSTPELWFRANPAIPELTKDRFRAFVATMLGNPAPSEQDEMNQPERAKDFYLAAGDWLRDKTRDRKRFPILFDELMTYGFRRNLLGLKYVSLVMNACVAGFCGATLALSLPYVSTISHLEEKAVAVLVVVVLHSLYMAAAVGKAAVQDASITYGKQQILSCEVLMASAKPTAAKPRARAPKP